jgi:hypothetical protein
MAAGKYPDPWDRRAPSVTGRKPTSDSPCPAFASYRAVRAPSKVGAKGLRSCISARQPACFRGLDLRGRATTEGPAGNNGQGPTASLASAAIVAIQNL